MYIALKQRVTTVALVIDWSKCTFFKSSQVPADLQREVFPLYYEDFY